MNILLATIIGFSLSLRTPNYQQDGLYDASIPLDYELSLNCSREKGKFTYDFKRDWERELGIEFIDTYLQVNQETGNFYTGIKYIDKQTRFLKYEQIRFGFNNKLLKVGVATDGNKTMLNFDLQKLVETEEYDYKLKLDISTDLETTIFDLLSELRIKMTDNSHIFALMKRHDYNANKSEQYKIGLGIKLK